MRRTIAAWAIAAGIGLTATLAARSLADNPTSTISGIWKVAMTPDAANAPDDKAFKDKLVFEDGQFTSHKLADYGFGAVACTSTGDKAFTVKQTSKTDGTAQWTGQVAADGGISGKLIWTKADGTAAKFTFAGTAVPTPPVSTQPAP